MRRKDKSMKYEFVAPCYFGTERSAAFDFKRLGAENITVTDGRVAFTGDEQVLASANIESRCAERILMLLKRAKVTTFDELFDNVFSIAWEQLLPQNAEFPVKGASLSSTLSSVPACQSIVKKAIVERLKKGHKTSVLPEDGELYKIRFSIRKDLLEVFLDTSGDGLHKRGYRAQSTEAPIKETLAATIVDLARVRGDSLVQDPFCGSGTIIIEAAQKAMKMAPGLRRRFLAEHYAFVPQEVWKVGREKALGEVDRICTFEGVGFDVDPHAVELANKNAKLAGVADHCRFFVADVGKFAPAPRSLVLTNPPYGERLGDVEEATRLEKLLGARIAENPVKGAYIITANAGFEQNFGKTAARRRKLYNGMIPCQLYMYF
ncbi:Ribosomal RNA large subunit methyltransferase K/L [bioreactor metagenome]|uniref:Ribosomal RNA large subunit methyltransferase K/L n=1 Tax=bioreactor metagenome TaxID=1076179 RepID=A0A645CBM5_9ZZZZ